jgi:hypothetical protein
MEMHEIAQVDYSQPLVMRNGREGKPRNPVGSDGLFTFDFADGSVQKIHYSKLRLLKEKGGQLAEI